MPFIEINGANIFYETFGQDQPGNVPILLIHGSTQTGRKDWSLVAPLLARRWRVIVPDSRGHGQSSNPHHSYSFREMADDNAALLHALGYERAHVIGHSNGGNVALVILMEHPEVCQTAIPQAANAYISPDLPEREPPLFDPDRVERESPEWMRDMIALHGPTHGQDYWRELLLITVKETISEPNYTPEDLKRVTRPTLVIQGENDGVNAPQKHAQFIARYIPFAELWLPSATGHNVHHERLFDWIETVESFLDRRGDDANDALYRLQQERYRYDRETVFQVKAELPNAGPVSLSGQVLVSDQRQAAVERISSLKEMNPSFANPVADAVRVLLDEATPWALVNRGVDDLWAKPESGAERVGQGLLGEVVRILEERRDWAWVRTENDGYLGWIHSAALHRCSQAEVTAYQKACQVRVVAEVLNANLSSDAKAGEKNRAGKLPFGVCLPVEARKDNLAQVRLPDGRLWWVDRSGLLPLDRCPQPNPEGVAFSLDLMRRFIGVPYLWGGRTPFGFDCSAFAQAFHALMGVKIPRDADFQFREGKPVEGPTQPGDLLYFGERDLDVPSRRFGYVTHVAISLGGDEMIHSNGPAWGVSYNSLNPASPIYRAWLRDNLLGVRRFV